ncbi:hypothetical protein [Herbidospora daliensis]|uniref:hypothetical protein n=1 Tax=Herbidospora daliensis TaxID=295585 RepID=UPI00078357D5|nr:hypothetical protein [Herbidospora daliensis]
MLRRPTIVLVLVAATGCMAKLSGETAVYQGPAGPVALIRWCVPPTSVRADIGVFDDDSNWQPVARYTSVSPLAAEGASLDLASPGPAWRLDTGDPTLSPGVEYNLSATRGDSGGDILSTAALPPGRVLTGTAGAVGVPGRGP